jgi:hypothetical protein
MGENAIREPGTALRAHRSQGGLQLARGCCLDGSEWEGEVTRKQLGYTRYGHEKVLAELILAYSGFENFDDALADSIERIKKHIRQLRKPVANAPRLTIAAE